MAVQIIQDNNLPLADNQGRVQIEGHVRNAKFVPTYNKCLACGIIVSTTGREAHFKVCSKRSVDKLKEQNNERN